MSWAVYRPRIVEVTSQPQYSDLLGDASAGNGPLVTCYYARWYQPCRELLASLEESTVGCERGWVLAELDIEAPGTRRLAAVLIPEESRIIPRVAVWRAPPHQMEAFSGAMPRHELSEWLRKVLDNKDVDPVASWRWPGIRYHYEDYQTLAIRYEQPQQPVAAVAPAYQQQAAAPQEPECVIEAHEKNLRLGQSLLSNILGGAALIRCEFAAHVYANGTDTETQAVEFSIFAGQDNSIELLVGTSREEAERQLGKLDGELRRWGWRRVQSSGPHWYSWRYTINQEGLVRYLRGIGLLEAG